MVISTEAFPARKRRPSAGAFISPKLSNRNLLLSLRLLTQEISSMIPFQFLLKRNSVSFIRKSKLLSILFEELLLCNPIPVLPPSAVLCFEEMHVLLQRVKALIEDCSNDSKMWLLMQNESMASSFHELTLELSTLLDIFPLKELNLNDDVAELVILIRNQLSSQSNANCFVDPKDGALRREVLAMLDQIKNEIVPDHSELSEIFARLGLRDASSCREEIENLEEEVQNQGYDKSSDELIALIGLVRYAKCVLFGASTPNSDQSRHSKSTSDAVVPSDFRCPISLDLMRDPVVVATGQTYDRESIKMWIESGHASCPKTGQTLAHTNLIPNLALKNLIAMWCREQKIPFEITGSKLKVNGVTTNKAALEAARMTATFLVKKLTVSQSMEAANSVVYELRALAKTDSDSRTCIAEAGAIPLLVRYLGAEVGTELPNLQVNAVTTILNLSILEANKTRIMETDGVLNGVVEVLRSGATWEARGNAAAAIFSLTAVHSHRRRLGRKMRVIKGLIELAEVGPMSSKRDALAAILNLAADRETVGRLIEAGVVQLIVGLMDRLPAEAVTILESVVKKGGFVAIAAAYIAIRKLCAVLREGSEEAQESAAATLVTITRKGGLDLVAELASTPGIERAIWELMQTGSLRARRKAATLLRILRRWAAGFDGQVTQDTTSTTLMSSSATVAA